MRTHTDTAIHTTARSRTKTVGIALSIAFTLATPPLFGCDTGVFAATTTIGVMRRAAPGVQYMRDPEIVEAAFPGSIQQMEGLLELKPEDATLRSMLGRSYGSYGYGFLEDHYEVAQLSDTATEEEIEHWRERASLSYLRGREVAIEGLDRIRPEGGGLLTIQRQGLEPFTAHLQRFDNRDEHAPLLFWAAYNWGRWISLNRDNMEAIADVPYVSAIADRVYALDATFMDHAPLALRAGLMAAPPAALGGRHAEARVELDRAIELTERRNLLYLVTEAISIAIPLQDRALYRSLLEEVVNFDVDSYPQQRLANLLAQRRARRYLERIDDHFAPEEEAPAAEEQPAAAP
jgi:hypothetical protein